MILHSGVQAEERAASLASAHSSASAMVAHFGSPGFQGRDGQQEASRATELVILKQVCRRVQGCS